VDNPTHPATRSSCGPALAGYSPEVDFHSNDFSVVLALVEAGLGVALVPDLALRHLTTTAVLRPVAEAPLGRELRVAIRRGSRDRPAVAAAVDALRTTAAALPARA